MTELRENRLAAYQRCPGDITEHARAENEMGLDYSNRLLLELMQNADDAAAATPIGYKGLGFKGGARYLRKCQNPVGLFASSI